MDSYEEILERMKNKYTELSGNEVPELSDIDIRIKVLAGEIYKEQVNLEFVKRQMFVQTATGEYLEYYANDRGLERKPSVKAKGRVRFILTGALETALSIPKGTIVATSGSVSHRYLTDNDAVVEAGKKSITISCTAEEGGADSNAVIGAVDVLVTTVPGVDYVTNTYAFTGGTDTESDDSLRHRIIDSYNDISNGTNKAYYKSLALSVPGVTSVGVIPKVRGTGTVDVYICNNKDTANDSLIARVQSIMDEAREINVDVSVASATKVLVSLGAELSISDGYDFNDVASRVTTAITDYINSLGVGDSLYETYIGKVILGVEGVKNYRLSSFYETEFIVEDDSFLVLETFATEAMAE